MVYMVGSVTATSATLSNLQCSTKYNISVHVESGSNKTGNTSVPIMISLPARGMYVCMCSIDIFLVNYHTVYCTL